MINYLHHRKNGLQFKAFFTVVILCLPEIVWAETILHKPITGLKLQQWTVNGGEGVNSYIRRGRIYMKTGINNIFVVSSVHFDFAGKNETFYPVGKTDNRQIKLWDAYMFWKPFKKREFQITGGLLLPQFTLETSTTPWLISSLDKARLSKDIRTFFTGTSAGISPGINLGGALGSDKCRLLYNLSAMNVTQSYKEEFMANMLVSGRFNLLFGDHFYTYKYKSSGFSFSKSNKFLIGVNAVSQTTNNLYSKYYCYGLEAAVHLKGFSISGELVRVNRENSEVQQIATLAFVRAAYSLIINDQNRLEVSAMYEYSDAGDVFLKNNSGEFLNGGLNYYCLNNKLKILLHNDFSLTRKQSNVVVLGIQILL